MIEKNLTLLCKNKSEERSIDFDVIKTIGKSHEKLKNQISSVFEMKMRKIEEKMIRNHGKI